MKISLEILVLSCRLFPSVVLRANAMKLRVFNREELEDHEL